MPTSLRVNIGYLVCARSKDEEEGKIFHICLPLISPLFFLGFCVWPQSCCYYQKYKSNREICPNDAELLPNNSCQQPIDAAPVWPFLCRVRMIKERPHCDLTFVPACALLISPSHLKIVGVRRRLGFSRGNLSHCYFLLPFYRGVINRVGAWRW